MQYFSDSTTTKNVDIKVIDAGGTSYSIVDLLSSTMTGKNRQDRAKNGKSLHDEKYSIDGSPNG